MSFVATPVIIPPPFPDDVATEHLKSLIANVVLPPKAKNAFPGGEGPDRFDSTNIALDYNLRSERVERQAKNVYDTDATTLQTTLAFFDTMKSHVYIAPEQNRTKDEPFYVELRPSDIIIPICHQGFNRSQIMRIALMSIFLKMNWNARDHILAPHGATSGCDPFTAYEDLNDGNFFGYIHDPGVIFEQDYTPATDTDPQSGPLHRSFYRTFGVRKCPRQGEEDVVPHRFNLNNALDIYQMEISRRTMRNRMSSIFRNLLLRASDESRVIFVCFCRAFPIILNRIIDVQPGVTTMRNVYVIGLPYADDTNTALRIMSRDADADTHLDKAHVQSLTEYASLFLTQPSMKRDDELHILELVSSSSSSSSSSSTSSSTTSTTTTSTTAVDEQSTDATTSFTNDSSISTPTFVDLTQVTTPTLYSLEEQHHQTTATTTTTTPLNLEAVSETVITIHVTATINPLTDTTEPSTANSSIIG